MTTEQIGAGQVAKVTVYITFAADDPGDDPLKSIYTPYDIERDIESLLSTTYGRGLEYETLKVEAVDAEWEVQQ